jgi:hypothetical protein
MLKYQSFVEMQGFFICLKKGTATKLRPKRDQSIKTELVSAAYLLSYHKHASRLATCSNWQATAPSAL